ncbi:uncharacterized protein (TIGR02677 family) [Saccharopolyspora spinosa]|uniref:Uncharacterized protein (TIGR02677 family) n=2 Tax=Saccharopolyspora spinosa TaxID=60894 RepID=A0A2N3Y6Y9_SACSN|nr:DUF2397 family protein [Saccharopolyspora spinosa]PKW18706.1 uncharacterized protein (TIGR02677 family) [Saccharopolyspora spinosa]
MAATWWKRIEPRLWRFAAEPADSVRERYAAVLGALLVASTRTPTATMADVRTLLSDVGYDDPLTTEDLRDVLDHLARSELVKVFRDYTAPVASLGEGVRRQEAWTLTKQGRVVVGAVHDAMTNIDRSLQLPPRLVDSVEDTVRRLRAHLDGNAELLATDLAQVRGHLEQLQSATGDFYEAVAALIQHDVTDDAMFTASRERILVALRQFTKHTERSLTRVRRALVELHEVGYEVVVERAVASAGLIDASGQQAWLDEQRQHLDALDVWFRPRGSIDRLIDSAAGAIQTLLGAIERRFYATTRGTDLGADFRQVARMLHAQTSEAGAHQVFAAAFGMWPAHHPRRPDTEDITPALTTAAGATCPVQVTLHETERGAHAAGRPRKVADVTADREAAEADTMAELTRMADLSANLVTPGVVTLTYFTGLDADHTAVLATLLEEALAAFDVGVGSGCAFTLQCQLRLWVGEPGRTVAVRLAEGTLTAPDLRVEVTVLDHDAAAEGEVA